MKNIPLTLPLGLTNIVSLLLTGIQQATLVLQAQELSSVDSGMNYHIYQNLLESNVESSDSTAIYSQL